MNQNQSIEELKTIEFVLHKGEKLSKEQFKKLGLDLDLTVIWLHGLGASGDDFVPVANMLNLDINIHYIFPHAPIQPVTINGGMSMPSWYDILEMIVERKIDDVQFDTSVSQIQSLIDQSISSGMKSDKVLLIGFSQGGAIAINAALTYPKKIAGVLALSTYIAKEPEINPQNSESPIFWFHGNYDDVVPISLSKKAADFFEQKDNPFEIKTYPMRHEVSIEQIKDIALVINQIAKP